MYGCMKIIKLVTNMKQMKQIHAQMVAGGIGEDVYVISRLVGFCSDPVHGSLCYAKLLFGRIELPTLCIYNTMMKAFLLSGELVEVAGILRMMMKNGVCPDNYTFPYLLKAASQLQDMNFSRQVHGQVMKLGYDDDIFVSNTLMLAYSDSGDVHSARLVFDCLPDRTEVAWTVLISGYCKQGDVDSAVLMFRGAPVKDRGIWGAMISGYVQNNCYKEGLKLFQLMQLEGMEPDESVLVVALCACAHMGALDTGTWIHRYVERRRFLLNARLGTALLDMYIKCGSLEEAKKVFEVTRKDVICWNAMILGLATHGDGDGSFELFSQMRMNGLNPDAATFVAIFTACSHSCMVDKGLEEFRKMKTVYGIEPRAEHYGCIVSLLGRAGRFEDAMNVVQNLPAFCNSVDEGIVWRALLSACLAKRETRFAELAAHHLVQLEHHSGAYILLSNTYAAEGRYDLAKKVRVSMKERQVGKVPGCSSIELGGYVHEFIAGEKAHPQMAERPRSTVGSHLHKLQSNREASITDSTRCKMVDAGWDCSFVSTDDARELIKSQARFLLLCA